MNDLQEQFVAEARELIAQATDDLIALERDGFAAARVERVFRAFHTLKGAAGVVDLPAMSRVLHAAEDLLAAIHGGSLVASPAIIDAALGSLDLVSHWVDGFEAGGAQPSTAGEAARAMVERMRGLLPETPIAAPPASIASSSAAALPDWAVRLAESAGAEIARLRRATPSALQAISYEPLPGCFFNGDDPLGLMRKLPGLLALQVEPREPWPELAQLDPFACNLRLRAIAASERAELDDIFRLVPDQVEIFAMPPDALALAGLEMQGRAASRSLRVDEARIDALVNLAGELTTAKNGLAHLSKRLAAEAVNRELADAIRRDTDGLDRLVTELRAAILRLRMVPLAQLFRAFPRLVRDMAQRLGKKVSFATEGETTPSDKAIVDLLFEPLLHLVRNALDHGIEPPDQRLAAAKPETATLTLQAQRSGDRLIIELNDDGRGIDPCLVRQRAVERGLLDADALAASSDADIVDLVFAAGFSTASEVSDISGRGVGMDVVRRTIEQAGGRVSLSSRPGFGTRVRLDLPTSIAMQRIMVVEAGGQRFGIPMDAVSTTLRLTPDRVRRIKANDGFVLDDRVVPICSLAGLMQLPPRAGAVQGVRLVVVAELGGGVAGLEIDSIHDRLDVVLKPLQGVLAGVRSYAGTTLLGDGSVLLVLDLKEIMP
jgi:two-component system chemotaxis sensor kinase CheA